MRGGGLKALRRIEPFLASWIHAFNVINRAAELRGQLPAVVAVHWTFGSREFTTLLIYQTRTCPGVRVHVRDAHLRARLKNRADEPPRGKKALSARPR